MKKTAARPPRFVQLVVDGDGALCALDAAGGTWAFMATEWVGLPATRRAYPGEKVVEGLDRRVAREMQSLVEVADVIRRLIDASPASATEKAAALPNAVIGALRAWAREVEHVRRDVTLLRNEIASLDAENQKLAVEVARIARIHELREQP